MNPHIQSNVRARPVGDVMPSAITTPLGESVSQNEKTVRTVNTAITRVNIAHSHFRFFDMQKPPVTIRIQEVS
jgi:hypothetical protein